MTCRFPQGHGGSGSGSKKRRSACGDGANGCSYGYLCGRHQSRARLAGKRLRQSFLRLDGLKADAQLEAAVSTIIKSSVYPTSAARAGTSTVGAASGVAAGAAAGAVAIVAKSAPYVPTLNGDTAADPEARRKRRREERYPQPQSHWNPQPHPPVARFGSSSGASANGASSAGSFRDEGDPLIGVPTVQASAMAGRWDASVGCRQTAV